MPFTDETRWDTEALTRDFEVLGYLALGRRVIVKRRNDGVEGTLEYTFRPRIYYGWEPVEWRKD